MGTTTQSTECGDFTLAVKGEICKATNTSRATQVISFYQPIGANYESCNTERIATGVADKLVEPSFTAKFLYLETNQRVKIKINDINSAPVEVARLAIIQDTSITKIYITNDSGNEAVVKIHLAG